MGDSQVIFPLGAVSVTPAAQASIAAGGAALGSLLARHAAGDSGDIDERLRSLNDRAVKESLPIFSAYRLASGDYVRVATSGDRATTSVTLPGELSPQAVSTKEGYARWASLYDEEKNALIAVEQHAVDSILAGHRYRCVLDAATGTGRHALNLARQAARVVAFDESEAMLAVARQRIQQGAQAIDLCRASLSLPLPFATGQFDLAVCALALCHLPDVTLPLREFARVLCADGLLLITDFHPDSMAYGWRTSFHDGFAHYELPNYPHSIADYLRAFPAAGLRVKQAIEIPHGAVPEGYIHIPEPLRHELAPMNFCLLILASRQTASV